ncbi:MAG TPA: PRC-barrel domain-containing protein [Solirubrobacteraceae bacterium]
MDDLGAPVSHLVLGEGVPVYDRDGQRIGVVDRVMSDQITGIFEGLIIHTRPLPGRHLYAMHDQVAELRERGVLLSVRRDDLYDIRERPAPRTDGVEGGESPIAAQLRRAWDWLTGVR